MNNPKIKRMTGIAMLVALVFVMQFISGIIPPVAGFPISLVLIPIVLGSAFFGISGGAVLGGVFGVIVYINCVNGTDPGGAMVFQADPVLCLLVVMGKGILAGVAAGIAYKLLCKKNGYVAMLLAAILCPLVNTGIFITCMLLFFKDILAVWAGGGDITGYILSGLVLVNFVPELIINVAVSPALQRIVLAVKK